MSKILITGPPRIGKSTLIKDLIEYFEKQNLTIDGFLTPELRREGKRIGFLLERIGKKEQIILAKKGNYKNKKKLGPYSVFLEEFEEFIEFLDLLKNESIDLIIIDEIGKMELLSEKFVSILKNLFESRKSIIGTIGLHINHDIKKRLLSLKEITLYVINRENRQELFTQIVKNISKI